MFNKTKSILLSIVVASAMIVTANATEIRIQKTSKNATTQPLIYKTAELLPKFAAKHGIKDLTVTLVESSNGSTANESLLLGKLDVAIAGINGFVPIFDKDPTKVRLLSGWETYDSWLVCTDPAIKTLADIKPSDKIAVKALNAGDHLTVRTYAAAQFGNAQYDKLADNMVVLSRDEAFQLMVANKLACGVIGSPWQNNIVKMGKAHVVGKPNGKTTFGFPNIAYTTTKWISENPQLAAAFVEAQQEAIKEYYRDPTSAIAVYLKNDSIEDVTPNDILLMKKENNDTYSTNLKPALAAMKFMYSIGMFTSPNGSLPDTDKVYDSKMLK